MDTIKTEITVKTQTFRSSLIQYSKEHIVNLVKKRDPLSIKIENEKSKAKINRNIVVTRRFDINKGRKMPRKIVPKASVYPLERIK